MDIYQSPNTGNPYLTGLNTQQPKPIPLSAVLKGFALITFLVFIAGPIIFLVDAIKIGQYLKHFPMVHGAALAILPFVGTSFVVLLMAAISAGAVVYHCFKESDPVFVVAMNKSGVLFFISLMTFAVPILILTILILRFVSIDVDVVQSNFYVLGIVALVFLFVSFFIQIPSYLLIRRTRDMEKWSSSALFFTVSTLLAFTLIICLLIITMLVYSSIVSGGNPYDYLKGLGWAYGIFTGIQALVAVTLALYFRDATFGLVIIAYQILTWYLFDVVGADEIFKLGMFLGPFIGFVCIEGIAILYILIRFLGTCFYSPPTEVMNNNSNI